MADTTDGVELGEKKADPTGTEEEADNHDSGQGNNHDDDHGGHDDHDDHAHATVEDTEPYKLHTMMDERPVTWFCVFCWLYLANFIILIPIIAVVGQNAIYITTDVPMYMRGHETRKREDALQAAWDEADFELESEISTTRQETPANVQLNLVFISKKSEGLNTEKALQDINEVVEEVITSKDFDKHCQLIYKEPNDTSPFCARPNKITDFFDVEYFKGSVNNSYDVEPTERNFYAFRNPSKAFNSTAVTGPFDFSDENIERITEYWAEYGEGTLNSSSEYGRGIYNNRQMQATFYFINPAGEQQELSNLFESLADQEFGETPDDTKINAALAIIRFGYPLQGYKSDSDKTDDQDEDISEWAYEQLHNYLWNYKSKYFTLYWGVGTMSDYYIEELIVEDMSLLIVTILCVWLYTVYTLKSFFLGCFGMLMIFMNFAPALLLYRYISQIKYFGTLNMLSIFIILSIGADDIFVLCDTWEQTRADSPNAPRPKRLTFTLNHAAKVMFTTSISTIFSFLGNTSSEFPAVYTFGGFCAWLVWVNYCGVVLFFPNILTLHEEYFWTPSAKFPWCIPKYCVTNQSPECCIGNLTANNAELERKASLGPDEEERRPIDLFFENTLHTFIYRWRLAIIAAFTVFFSIFLGFAAQLVPDPDPPQFFPDGNNYYEYNYALLDYFGAADNLRILNVLAMGIQGINRRGTDEAITEDIGKPRWDKDYYIASPDSQLFVAQFCDDLLCGFNDYDCRYDSLWRNLKIEEPRTSRGLDVVRCWMTELRDWFENDPDAILDRDEQQALIEDNNITYVTADDMANCTYGEFPMSPDYCYELLTGYVWVTDDLPTSNPDYRAGATNYDYWKDVYGVEDTTDDSGGRTGATLRFNTIEVKLDAYTTTEYRDGMRLWDRWDDYVNRWLEGENGDISIDQFGQEFVTDTSGVSSLFFTDEGGVWSYFFVQAQIIYESLTGIALSLSLAFIVLVAATGNWIIAIMAIATITQLVILIMGFTVMQGYKLGVMEAIIFVMVVGMVVDYVVHCSEAYLHAKAQDRVGRSKGMLGLVGMSVVSGSFSTVVGVCWMLLATIGFFFKFGTSILFQEATSLAYALIYFTALLSVAGPQNKDGDVKRDYNRVKMWCEWRYSMWCGDGTVPEPDWNAEEKQSETPKISNESPNQDIQASNKNEGNPVTSTADKPASPRSANIPDDSDKEED